VQVLPAPKANLDCSWAICRVKSRFPSEICRVADLTRQIARPRFSKRLGYQTGHQSASRQKHLFPTTAATLPHAPMSAEGTEGAFPSRPALIRLKDHHTASKRKAPTNPMARAHEAQTKTATQLESWMAVRCVKCLWLKPQPIPGPMHIAATGQRAPLPNAQYRHRCGAAMV